MQTALRKNESYDVEIRAVSGEGSGVCKINDMVVFVPQTAIGDRCTVKIVKVLSHHAYGIITELHTPSPDRVLPDCPVYRQCGGCTFRHMTYAAELKIKEQSVKDAFERLGKISAPMEPILPGEHENGYRNKAQYPVGEAGGRLVYGFYAPHSHRIVPCTDCALQPPLFSEIAQEVCKRLDGVIAPYDEEKGTGELRHLYLRYGEKSGEVLLCLIVTKDLSAKLRPLLQTLPEQFPQIASISLNINARRDNVILGKKTVVLYGKEAIRDQLCGLTVELSPLSFYQVNRSQAERLYGIAKDYAGLTGSETVVDLYCGVGTIGLSMADRCEKLIGVEIIPEAIENAKENAVRNNIGNAKFLCADAKEATKMLQRRGLKPDVVLLDPPRKGCDPSVIGDVVAMAPDRVVMISCNPSTAARDCRLFEEQGYRVLTYRPVDMFPRTGHVETVVLLSQQKPDDHIEIEINPDEIDATSAETKATYKEIQVWVQEKYGFHVTNLNIAQVKQKHEIIERENYNKPKSENSRQPGCPEEKVKAIEEALRQFQMIK